MKFSHESRLIKFLLRRYKRAGKIPRPVLNSTSTMKIEFSVALIQILDFDETNQVLETNVWKRYVSMAAMLTFILSSLTRDY